MKIPVTTKINIAVGIAVTFAAGIAIGLHIASALIGGWLK